jgi:hypothetical protein
MRTTELTIAELLRRAVGLGNDLLDAAESAVLEEHARYCGDVAAQIWRSACHLRQGIPATDIEYARLNELCVALERRLEAAGLKQRH